MTTGNFGRENETPAADIAKLGSWLEDKTRQLSVSNAANKKAADELADNTAVTDSFIQLAEVREDVALGQLQPPNEEDFSPEDKLGLSRASAIYERSQKMIRSGQSQAAAEAMLTFKAKELAKQYPGLGKEIFAAARGMETSTFVALDSEQLEREGKIQALQDQQYGAMWDKMQLFYPPGVQPDPKQLRADFERKGFGDLARSAVSIDAQLDELKSRNDLTDAQRKEGLDNVAKDPEFRAWRGALYDDLHTISRIPDNNARKDALLKLRGDMQSKFIDFGIRSESEIKSYMGDYFGQLDKLSTLDPSSDAYKQAQNNNLLQQELIKSTVRAENPGFHEAIVVSGELEKVFGEQYAKNVMITNGGQEVSKMMAKAAANVSLRIVAAKQNTTVAVVSGNSPQAVLFDPTDALETQTSDVRAASQTMVAALLSPNMPGKGDVVNAYIGLIEEVSAGATNANGYRRYEGLLDQFQDASFISVLEAHPQLAVGLQDKADDALTAYTARLVTDGEKKFGSRPTLKAGDDGVTVEVEHVEADFRTRVSRESDRARLQSKMNRAVRALAHSMGTTDYKRAAQAIASEVNK